MRAPILKVVRQAEAGVAWPDLQVNFALKMTNFALQMTNCPLQLMNRCKMMKFALKKDEFCIKT